MIWRSLRVWLMMFLIFAAGGVVGGLVTLRGIQKFYAARMDPTQWSPRTMAWLTKELKLTAEQQTKVKPEIDAMAVELKKLMDDAEAERKGIFARTLISVSDNLTPEQQTTLRQLLKAEAARKARRL